MAAIGFNYNHFHINLAIVLAGHIVKFLQFGFAAFFLIFFAYILRNGNERVIIMGGSPSPIPPFKAPSQLACNFNLENSNMAIH